MAKDQLKKEGSKYFTKTGSLKTTNSKCTSTKKLMEISKNQPNNT